MGWVAAVAVAESQDGIVLVHSSIVATAEEGDRIAKEPYHVAAGWDGLTKVLPHPDPAVAGGAVLATRGLQRYSLEEALSHPTLPLVEPGILGALKRPIWITTGSS